MYKLFYTILLAIILIVPCWSSEKPIEQVKIEKIRDNFFRIACSLTFDVNLLAFTGKEGILLVDTGFSHTADELIKKTKQLGNGKIRYVINTHEDGDHTAGNSLLDDQTVIIAHKNARRTIGGGYFELEPYLTKGVPQVAVENDLTLFFNGEEIRLKHFNAAHTTGDIIVHFVKSGIVHVGDIIFSGSYAGFHVETGGDAEGYFAFQKKLIDYLPDDVLIIPGHGQNNLTKAEFENYYATMRKGVETILAEFNNGKDTDKILNSPSINEWKAMDGTFFPLRDWIDQIKMQYLKNAGKYKSPMDRVVHEYLHNDIDSALRLCRTLRIAADEGYQVKESDLNTFGYQLLFRNKVQDAIKVLSLNIEFFPESGNTYDSLAEAYLKSGDKNKAVEYYIKSLEKDPNNTNARNMLKQLGHN